MRIETLRDAIRATIEQRHQELHVYDTVPEDINLPAVVIAPVNARFDVAMGRGTDTWLFDLSVVVSWADSEIAQDQLDGYVSGSGAQSIRETMFTNRTLGLTGVDAHVSELTQYAVGFAFASIPHLGGVLRLIVHTRGTE